jgi:hypothetical protein
MKVLNLANVGTGISFKNHPMTLIPSLHHLELNPKEKEMMTTLTLKKKT